MNNQQLYIPEKINIGFQSRSDTYTGKLAYIIYYDGKGVLRKEKSWQSWRDKKIAPVEFKNEPMDGFVLNKNVGGYKSDWNYRSAHIRVYDPRDFEFEIDVPNLLFILKECDCNKGKGLEGKFVYAWQGTELCLLPVGCQDYKNSKNFTDLQMKSVKGKELIAGASYTTKKQDTLTYLGRFDYHFVTGKYGQNEAAGVEKRYVFWNDTVCQYSKKKIGFVYMKDLKSIATLNSDIVSSEYARLVELYHKSVHGSKIVSLFLKDVREKDEEDRDNWYFEEDGAFVKCSTQRNWTDKKIEYITRMTKSYIKDGVYHADLYAGIGVPPGMENNYQSRYSYHWSGNSHRTETPKFPYREPTHLRLFAELESGAKHKVEYNTFGKDR